VKDADNSLVLFFDLEPLLACDEKDADNSLDLFFDLDEGMNETSFQPLHFGQYSR
jgi:hypothetical protein